MAQKYRLEVLLKTREREKRRAEELLAKAISALTRARQREDELKEEKKKIHEEWKQRRMEMRDRMDAGGRVSDGNVHVRYLRKLKEDEAAKDDEITTQHERVLQCERRASEARREYIDAVKAMRVMEKHKELWRKKVAAEISRKEEREFDELGNIIHGRRQRGDLHG